MKAYAAEDSTKHSTGSVLGKLAPWLRTDRLAYTRDLLFELVVRDIKLRYKRSVLGIVWSLLNPLLQLLVFYFVFGRLLPLNIPHYASFLFTGVLAWNWFQSSLLFAVGSIVEHRELIKHPGFPVSMLPIVTVTGHLVHFVLALPILFLCLLFDVGHISGAVVALPLVIALQFVFTLSIAYLVATFHVWFRDTQYLLGVLLQLMFFLTPIFYSVRIIPERFRSLLAFNPMVLLMETYRSILVVGEMPIGTALLRLVAFSAVFLAIGYAVFVRASYRFVEEL